MLWYKAWLETRWRFIAGAGILLLSAAGTVIVYPQIIRLIDSAPALDTSGEIGRRVRENVELARTYRGYIWAQAFGANLPQLATLFAALLGSGGVLSRGTGAALFTLSMPVSRTRVLGVRAAAGLAELAVITFVPTLAILVFSPAVGQRYGIVDGLVHALCLFTAAAVFYNLALLMSTAFDDIWRPLLIACGAAFVAVLADYAVSGARPYGLFHLMTGEGWFRTRQIPWIGLVASAALSTSLLYAATVNIARRDF